MRSWSWLQLKMVALLQLLRVGRRLKLQLRLKKQQHYEPAAACVVEVTTGSDRRY